MSKILTAVVAGYFSSKLKSFGVVLPKTYISPICPYEAFRSVSSSALHTFDISILSLEAILVLSRVISSYSPSWRSFFLATSDHCSPFVCGETSILMSLGQSFSLRVRVADDHATASICVRFFKINSITHGILSDTQNLR